MIQSMTGFGRGEAANDKYKVTVEMKSVNHRYLDISVRVPRSLNFLESAVRNQAKRFAGRGKLDIYVNVEDLEKGSGSIRYNPEIASAYLEGLRRIAEDFRLEGSIDAIRLSCYPDVFTMEDEKIDEAVLLPLITEGVRQAGEKFTASRRAEGETLYQDITAKLETICLIVDEIDKRFPKIVEEHRRKLTEKIHELLDDTKIEESILAAELVIYCDKICVDEETVRLRTHIGHVRDTLREGANIGRKLDFLVQEMNREANTILSKSNDVEVSNFGIELKTEIEKIREQIQNIE